MSSDPLRASLAEQLEQLRDGPLPEPLLDVVSVQLTAGADSLTLIRPRDWDELRHQEGGARRGVPYWALLWPSGLALASELASHDLHGKRVLELGCGLGAPSVVAAHRGASVLATDSAPEAVVFTAHNLALNDLTGDVARLDWRDMDALADGAPWDLVIAADILYLRHNVEALTRLLPIITGSDRRSADRRPPPRGRPRLPGGGPRRVQRGDDRGARVRERGALHSARWHAPRSRAAVKEPGAKRDPAQAASFGSGASTCTRTYPLALGLDRRVPPNFAIRR